MLPPIFARPDHVEKALKTRYHDAMSILRPQGKELDLLIVVLPDNNGSLYGICQLKYYILFIKKIGILSLLFTIFFIYNFCR